MILSAHQLNYLPYPGLLSKINSVGIAPPGDKFCEYNLHSFSILAVVINSKEFTDIQINDIINQVAIC